MRRRASGPVRNDDEAMALRRKIAQVSRSELQAVRAGDRCLKGVRQFPAMLCAQHRCRIRDRQVDRKRRKAVEEPLALASRPTLEAGEDLRASDDGDRRLIAHLGQLARGRRDAVEVVDQDDRIEQDRKSVV